MKQIEFKGRSLKDLRDFPETARNEAGFELREIQKGNEPTDWKPMSSSGTCVKEIRVKDLPLGKDIVTNSVESLEDLEKNHIRQILNKYNRNISRSAKALNIDRVTLYNKIKKYNLKSPE